MSVPTAEQSLRCERKGIAFAFIRRALCIAVGALLIFAAVKKAQQLATVPSVKNSSVKEGDFMLAMLDRDVLHLVGILDKQSFLLGVKVLESQTKYRLSILVLLRSNVSSVPWGGDRQSRSKIRVLDSFTHGS